MVRIAAELMNRDWPVAATTAAGAAGADAGRGQHVAVAALARRGSEVERGDQ
jgi:hypothetical protein